MLRSIIKSKHLLAVPRKALSTLEPSTTTTVILKNLSASTSEASLKAAVSEIVTRKVEIEPGCSIHLSNEAEATYVSSLLESKFQYDGRIASTTMPSLLLQNLPSSVCSHRLEKAFSRFQPKLIRLIGSSSVQVIMKSAEEALIAQKLIGTVSIGESSLKTHVVKLPDQTFAVLVNNFHNTATTTEAEQAVRAALSPSFDDSIVISTNATAPQSAALRFNTRDEAEVAKIVAALNKINFHGHQLVVGEPKQIKKPALFIRNVRKIGHSKLVAVMSQMGCDRLRINNRTKDVVSDLAVAFFPTEESAFKALHQLKNMTVEDVKIAVSFREVAEPALTVSHLPIDFTEFEVLRMFEMYKPVRVALTPTETGVNALVVLGGPGDVQLAAVSMNRKIIRGRAIAVEATPVHDTGIDLSLVHTDGTPTPFTPTALFQALLEAGVEAPKGISIKTNISAFLSFMTVDEAVSAHSSFIDGSTIIDSSTATSAAQEAAGGLVTSRISAHPSFVVEVSGMSPETPYQQILSALEGDSSETGEIGGDSDPLVVRSLRVDRTAVLKFKKAHDVIFNVKKLRAIEMDGKHLKAIRYRPVVVKGDNPIDEEGADEAFDQYGLMHVMKDYMYADQATRYQVVKNHFERAVADAKNLKDPNCIIDEHSTPAMVTEVKKILAGPLDKCLADERLFELYIQRHDLNMLTHDFRESEAFFGPADINNDFDWSNFLIEDWDDIAKYQENIRVAEEKQLNEANIAAGIAPGTVKRKSWQKTEIILPGENGEAEERINLEKLSELTDKEGRVWSGAILDTDLVQKPMPGGRVMSHRALVVVGNLRGAAGFGMGKGKSPADAVSAAFRDSLRNLVFIDLYEQFGFAHDLHGKHNSCHAYIRATGRERMMVGSPFASAVLERFGIGSASVKLVGRRDPYAMVRALFDAVQKHENIDEFAKDRGKRYLTLKWLYENNV